MKPMTDLTGRKFNRLTVLSFHHKDNQFKAYWSCRCDCGSEVVVRGDCLTTQNTKACGCLLKESGNRLIKYITKHGGSKTRIYSIWQNMRDRCSQNSIGKDRGLHYASRGINICAEWGNFESFRDWALANGYSDQLSIDRINVNGNYEPSNCRWTSMEVQLRNMQDSIYLECNGVNRHLKEWAEITGINYQTLYQRYRKDKRPEFILSPAIRGGKKI